MESKIIKKEIEIDLSQEQMENRAQIGDNAQARIDELETERANGESAFKALKGRIDPELDTLREVMAKAHRERRHGKAKQIVDVEMRKNFEACTVEFWYQGKIIPGETRAMTANERQASLWEVEGEQVTETGMKIDEAEVVNMADAKAAAETTTTEGDYENVNQEN